MENEIKDKYIVISNYPPFEIGDIVEEWVSGLFSITANFTTIDKSTVVNNPELFEKL